ncbi:hypothetical protein PFICI_14688 [Pestalotiopsis fici W106-1]|uniref:Secreted protein n=1 Tax=Pestalotiopsis fici (strain W106-1 / CGMCC3.15140) TaxID=1229662 RepID=W3WKT4_PESFW|nr:uncharacterized protein PFICI_14688 [Pestalotiopsis fici W106-1]ETS73742.1 hypothetical protein PFICI_14688 [Pestalotiopsis fici W106-1]
MKSVPLFAVLLLTCVNDALGYAITIRNDDYDNGVDPICIGTGPESCQGVYKCDNANLDSLECAFYVYNSNCQSLHPDEPWATVQSGVSFTYDGLDHSIDIQNATGSLDALQMGIVWKYMDGLYGDGYGNVRGDCSTKDKKCAFMRSAFTCK